MSVISAIFKMIGANKLVIQNNTVCLKFIQHRNITNKSVRDVSYQYLQRSKVPTMHFQKSLPRLPIPELSKTGERYLNAIRPIISNDQYKAAEQRTHNFLNKEGKVLQDSLVALDKRNKHTSYISEYWYDLYLRDRSPLPINYNPLIVFVNDSRPEYNNQLVRSTNMLISAVRFMLSLRDHILEPEVYHLNPKKSNTQLFRTVTGMLPQALSWYVILINCFTYWL